MLTAYITYYEVNQSEWDMRLANHNQGEIDMALLENNPTWHQGIGCFHYTSTDGAREMKT